MTIGNHLHEDHNASINYITKSNLLQHLKVVQRSAVFNLSVTHLLAEFYCWQPPCKISKELAPTIQYGAKTTSKNFVWDANPGYREYIIYD